eukprot:m.343027 g.343027  ORF g.343027 m.343027 type:complete len:51 (+) comp27865_c5_seq6:260-412(+)
MMCLTTRAHGSAVASAFGGATDATGWNHGRNDGHSADTGLISSTSARSPS